MNNLTRVPLILLRKIRLDLYRAIAELRSIEQSSDPAYEPYSSDHEGDKTEADGELLSAIHAINEAQGSADAKKYALDHRRYRLEWKGFRVARWGVVGLIIYTVVTAVIMIYSIRSADAAKESARATKEATQRAYRPWIGNEGEAKIVISSMQPMPDESAPNKITVVVGGEFSFAVKNFGPSPALSLGYGMQMFVRTRGDESDFNEAKKAACGEADAIASITGYSVFPGQAFTFKQGGFLVPGMTSGYTTVLMETCVAYTDQFFSKRTTHHTTSCYIASIKQPGVPGNCGMHEIAD